MAGGGVQLGGGWSGRALERLEDRVLGDPVATLQVRVGGMQRSDRRQRVRQVIEDEDEVGLDEGGCGRPDGIGVRERDARLEDRDGVVGQRPDGAAGEARHALGRLDTTPAHEATEREQRVGRVDGRDRQLGVVSIDGDGPVLDARLAMAHFEQPTRADAQERVAAQALPSLDRLEEVGGVVPSSSRRNAPMGVSRSADRVARRRSVSALPASRFAWVRLSGSVMVTCGASGGPCRLGPRENRNDLSSIRDERPSLPRCHPHSAMPHFLTDGWSFDPRSALPAIAGALRRSLLGSRVAAVAVRSGGSRVHSSPLPPRLPPAAGSLCRHSTGTRPVRSPYSRCRAGV